MNALERMLPQQPKRNALLELLQSASNAAAGSVSGPIDLLAMGLRAAGVPVPADPVLSSQWMAQRGLTREVPKGATQVAGETLGLLSPAVAAAKAPQIASGLLRVAENAAAPTAAGRAAAQRGAIVWHGSPHTFDRFDSSKIGTGEGAQAYGHGLYLAESPDVAQQYQRNLTANSVTLDGKPLGALSVIEREAADYATEYGGVTRALEVLDGKIKHGSRFDDLDWLRQVRDKLAASNYSKSEGGLYKVDLPDSMIARMLDWDKPLSQQGAELQDIFSGLSRLGVDDPLSLPGGTAYRRMHEAAIRQGKPEPAAIKEAQMVRGLRAAGIPGIRYLDGGSRGAGQGTSNFVVFPGEENALSILERNGRALR